MRNNDRHYYIPLWDNVIGSIRDIHATNGNEGVGRFIMAIIEYVEKGKEPKELEHIESMAFRLISFSFEKKYKSGAPNGNNNRLKNKQLNTINQESITNQLPINQESITNQSRINQESINNQSESIPFKKEKEKEKENDKDNLNPIGFIYNSGNGGKNKFKIPTLDEVNEYITTNNLNINGKEFFYFYQSKGWKVGKNPMTDWHASAHRWNSNHNNQLSEKNQNNGNDIARPEEFISTIQQ